MRGQFRDIFVRVILKTLSGNTAEKGKIHNTFISYGIQFFVEIFQCGNRRDRCTRHINHSCNTTGSSGPAAMGKILPFRISRIIKVDMGVYGAGKDQQSFRIKNITSRKVGTGLDDFTVFDLNIQREKGFFAGRAI